MENSHTPPQGLTEKEKVELMNLRKQIFGGAMFEDFSNELTPEDFETPNFLRLEELTRKHNEFLSYYDKLVMCN